MATRTPFGFALALTALYTGSAITTGLLTTSYDDPNPTRSAALSQAQPTLVYATAEGASSLACALAACSRRSPLASWAAKSKLFTLRNGTFSRQGLADSLVFKKAREATGTLKVRNVLIAGRGDTVPQTLLDSLRSHLGCSVLNAYLPELQAAAVTAPVSSTHAFDLQAFAEHEIGAMQVPAHVGPPSVSAEIKLVQSQAATEAGLTMTGDRQPGHAGDPMGEIMVRGNIVARGISAEDAWSVTGDLGAFRSNEANEWTGNAVSLFDDRGGLTSLGALYLGGQDRGYEPGMTGGPENSGGKNDGAWNAITALLVLFVMTVIEW